MRPSIRVSGVSKCFHIYDRPLDRLLQGFVGSRRQLYREFWALQDVSLEVWPGETVGIAGKNGSGKSTLLQIIAGTMQPTSGQIQVNGRVAALLELGSGFSPDFTGRENVRLNGIILGLSGAEMDSRMPQIEAFAELGDFLDQPVRTYSSGMYMRLAFSVAIHTQPDILIIDEALAVGDEAFQRKCFARIEELKQGGATILFVSHSAASVTQLCDRAVLLDQGRRIITGRPKKVVAGYQRLLYALPDQREQVLTSLRAAEHLEDDSDVLNEDGAAASGEWQTPEIESLQNGGVEYFDPGFLSRSATEYPHRGARICDPHIRNAAGERCNVLLSGERYVYTFEVEFERQVSNVSFGMMLRSVAGVDLFGMSSHASGEGVTRFEAGDRCRVDFIFSTHLLPGTYFLNAGCQGSEAGGQIDFLHRILDATTFRIDMPASSRQMFGFYNLSEEPACQWQRVGERASSHE